MDKAEHIKKELFPAVLAFVREKYPDDIDKAYEYFFEEEYPEDFLTATALDMAFINFEDFLIYDYKAPDKGFFIDLYIEHSGQLSEDDRKTLGAMKESFISLYEVKAVGGGIITLEDLLLGGSPGISESSLPGVEAGSLFGARLYRVDNDRVMSGCIYPYSKRHKDKVLGYINNQFERYRRHKNPDGALRDFLKEESYIFNVIWITALFKL